MKKTLLALAVLMMLPLIPTSAKKLHTIGDSTMESYQEGSTDKRGWAQMLQQFFNADEVIVNNRGKSGCSSRTFYTDSRFWASVKSQMAAGDILVIQFAHNDEKNNGMDIDTLNAYNAAHGQATETDMRGTCPYNTYKDFLRKYINEAKAMGVKPILVAPICRKYFASATALKRSGLHDLGDKYSAIVNGVLKTDCKLPSTDHTMDYVYQMQQVAMEYPDVPFIDLTSATRDLYLSYGEAYCTAHLFCLDDSTHPAAMGATLIARLFAQLVQSQAQGGETDANRRAVLQELASAVVLSSEVSFSPASGDLGQTFMGQTLNKEFNVSAFGMTPAEGTMTFTATNGFLVSTDKQNYAAQCQVAYTGSTLITPLYVRYDPTAQGTITATITATNGSLTTTLPLTLEVSAITGQDFSIIYPLTNDAEGVANSIGNALGQVLSEMEVKQYAALDTDKERMQLLQLTGQSTDGAWPAGEIDEVSTRYVEFGFECPAEMKMTITSLGLHIAGRGGGGVCAKAYYSTNADFSSPVQIFEQSKMTAKQVYECQQDVAVQLKGGERIYIRVYPWYNTSSAVTGKWLCLSQAFISGRVESAEGSSLFTVEANPSGTQKVMLDGQLYLIRNGLTYTTMGQVVK